MPYPNYHKYVNTIHLLDAIKIHSLHFASLTGQSESSASLLEANAGVTMRP
jgi:hypothetical protein